MVRTAAAFAILAVSATAVSATDLSGLFKRQTLSGDSQAQINGLLDLANKVLTDASSGNITSQCLSWSSALADCQSNTSDQVQIAICSCNSDNLSQMTSCSGVYGSEGQSDASGFTTFCTQTLPTLTGGASGSNSTASSISSAASSAVASETGAIASLSSAASSASRTASSRAGAAASGSAGTSSASAAGASGSSKPSSGAGKNAVVGGFAGLVGLVAALAF
ncbi:hypothetical protein JCM10296v2_003451 [Rhodotorula toruloides]